MNELTTDTRPYWQRQGRTVNGWAGHRAAVQRWKKRNPKRARQHCKVYDQKQKALYGTKDSDAAWIKKASRWNETQGL